MLRIGDTIRLNDKDRKDYEYWAGHGEAPKTVSEYNKRLEQAARAWEAPAQGDTPEARLLAALARGQMLPW